MKLWFTMLFSAEVRLQAPPLLGMSACAPAQLPEQLMIDVVKRQTSTVLRTDVARVEAI